jgi:hypothetical protein
MTQKERVLEYLESGKGLTRLNSWEHLGVIETPSRISELRADGWPIKTEMITVYNRYHEKVRVARWTL